MSITTVRGTSVDCHICRTTTPFGTEAEAHGHAQGHAWSHQVQPVPVPQTQVVVQSAPAYPHRAKTSINHTPHLILDCLTFGFWIPVHITLAILGSRKTTFR